MKTKDISSVSCAYGSLRPPSGAFSITHSFTLSLKSLIRGGIPWPSSEASALLVTHMTSHGASVPLLLQWISTILVAWKNIHLTILQVEVKTQCVWLSWFSAWGHKSEIKVLEQLCSLLEALFLSLGCKNLHSWFWRPEPWDQCHRALLSLKAPGEGPSCLSGFWWPQAVLGSWLHHSSLCFCHYMACSSVSLLFCLIRTRVIGFRTISSEYL